MTISIRTTYFHKEEKNFTIVVKINKNYIQVIIKNLFKKQNNLRFVQFQFSCPHNLIWHHNLRKTSVALFIFIVLLY